MKKLFLSSSPSGHPLRAFFVTQSRGGVCLKSISVLFFYYELRIIFSIFSFHRSLDTITYTSPHIIYDTPVFVQQQIFLKTIDRFSFPRYNGGSHMTDGTVELTT